jgi:hypothetical protein
LPSLATAVAVTAVFGASSAAAALVPVFGDAFSGSIGYGHAHPVALSSGGNAVTTTVHGLHWKHWGAGQAVGMGTGYWLPPGKPMSAAQPATAEVVAFDLGTCKGKRAYLKMKWFLPGHGGSLSTSHANQICV